MAQDDLYQAASDLRDACVTLLGEDAPAAAYVRNGSPIADVGEEDQLTVHVPSFGRWPTPVTVGPASWGEPQMAQIAGPPQITFAINLIRCAEATDAANQEAVAMKCYGDAWLLWNGLKRMIVAKTIFTGEVEPGPEPMTTPVSVVNEEGNTTGWLFGVICTLAGYDPTLPPPSPPPPPPPAP